ncbi:MAG: hypothetical protein JW850_14260, partial [Thermoflexales bacterium]|nr:hypothetical protein [Thermoflexales bacterium]
MTRKIVFTLIALITVASMLVSACTTPATPQPTATTPPSQPAKPTAEPAKLTGKVEIFSWWTGGGEADGLAQMFGIYSQKYPNVEIINATVAGGAGSNAKAVLKTRMLGGDPPDSFQVHAGQEIADWVYADKMEPLDDLY